MIFFEVEDVIFFDYIFWVVIKGARMDIGNEFYGIGGIVVVF